MSTDDQMAGPTEIWASQSRPAAISTRSGDQEGARPEARHEPGADLGAHRDGEGLRKEGQAGGQRGHPRTPWRYSDWKYQTEKRAAPTPKATRFAPVIEREAKSRSGTRGARASRASTTPKTASRTMPAAERHEDLGDPQPDRLAADDAPGDGHQAGGDGECPGQVEVPAPRRVPGALGDEEAGGDQHRDPDRQVDEEDPAPGEELG